MVVLTELYFSKLPTAQQMVYTEDERSQDKGPFSDLRSTERSPPPKKRILVMKPFKYTIVYINEEASEILSLEKHLLD